MRSEGLRVLSEKKSAINHEDLARPSSIIMCSVFNVFKSFEGTVTRGLVGTASVAPRLSFRDIWGEYVCALPLGGLCVLPVGTGVGISLFRAR